MENGVIQDDLRIRSSLPTLQWLIERGARVTVCGHIGRPKGQVMPGLSMEPVRRHLQSLLPGVEVLENVRFEPGEKTNDPEWVARLIDGQDLFVNDAFSVCHRSEASVVGPPAHLPSAAGRLVENEVGTLAALLDDPKRPFIGIVGGAKVKDKLGVIHALLDKVDTLLIGGGMAYTFLAAMGRSIGESLLQEDQIAACAELLDSDHRIVLPVDILAAAPDGRELQVVGRDIPNGWEGLDIGPQTRVAFADEIKGAQTVLWNGPMGRFEDPRFADGTRAVATAMAETTAYTVIGGGDSASAIAQFGLADRVDHLSTGGGASLEFIEKGDLPGLAALRQAYEREQR